LGANITTLLDTLLAATLLGNPVAVQVVLLQMLGVALVSMVILVLLLRVYERFMEILVEFISRRRRNMFVYVLVIFVVPLLLLIYG